jgi:hypothetical protein
MVNKKGLTEDNLPVQADIQPWPSETSKRREATHDGGIFQVCVDRFLTFTSNDDDVSHDCTLTQLTSLLSETLRAVWRNKIILLTLLRYWTASQKQSSLLPVEKAYPENVASESFGSQPISLPGTKELQKSRLQEDRTTVEPPPVVRFAN